MFAYKGIGVDGALAAGTVEAEDAANAERLLGARHLRVLSVKRTSAVAVALSNGSLPLRPSRRDAIEFARNMGAMIKAGIPILDALGDVSHTIEKKLFKDAVLDIRDRIISGSNLSDAFSVHPRIFPDILIRLVKVGEETGRLELSLLDVANHLERMEDLAVTVKQALVYPAFVFFVAGGALLFWVVYVFPKLISIIGELGGTLPLITRVMFSATALVRSSWYLLVLGIAAALLVIKVAKKKEAFSYYYDLFKMRLPIVKSLVHYKHVASFAEQMKIMTVAGITVDRSLTITAGALGSEVFKRALMHIRDRVSAGSRISDAIREHDIFPNMVSRLVEVGESSGDLGGQFAFLSEYYFKKLDQISARLGKMVEPLMISVVGLIFVLMVMAILLPIYDVVTKLK